MPRRIMEGVVVSTKQDKTAIVRVERTFLHPLLRKTVRKSKRYHAHDENNVAQEGQKVSFDLEEAKNGKTNAVNLQKQ